MTVKELLIEQMNNTFTQKNWFVSLTESLKGLTVKLASYKSSDNNHSIREIVIHLIYWNEIYLKRFRGVSVDAFSDNDLTFTEKSLDNKHTSWESIVEQLEIVLTDWKKELIFSDEKKLSSIIQNGTDTWASAIANIISHTAYHLGQIVCLRKVQNNWDSKLGV